MQHWGSCDGQQQQTTQTCSYPEFCCNPQDGLVTASITYWNVESFATSFSLTPFGHFV